jgi:arsenical-resistance protein 2
MATQDDGTPWWAAFPEPKSRCESIEPTEVAEMLEKLDDNQPRTFLLVDVRRTDWTGGTVASSINLPAHSFYPTRKIVYDLCKQASIAKIIFYCGRSS